MSKPRSNLRLRPEIHKMLEVATRHPGATKSAIVEQALREFFDPSEKSKLEEKLIARLDQFDARQAEIERDMALCLETLGHFVFYWLTRTDPIPEGERDAAHALGERRFDYFIAQVARKIFDGDTVGLKAGITGPAERSARGSDA